MTRVLCVTSWFPPHHFGGYELSCHDVMARLAERGHHVEVLTSDHRHPDVDDAAGGEVVVHRELRLYLRDGELWQPGLLDRLRVERHNQAALRAAIESCRPDVVAVWHLGALSLGLVTAVHRLGIPVVHAVSDDWPIYAPGLDPWTRAAENHPTVVRLLGSVAGVPTEVPDLDRDIACFISEATRAACRRSSRWTFPRSSIVFSGIDLDLFDGGDRPTAPGDGRARLLYVGRIDERKGIRTLLSSLGDLPGAELVVDGRLDDRGRALLDTWTTDAGVADRVTVQCSDRADLPDVYRSADVCVFPSEWDEPFGLVPLEAMACGTPVVATGTGGSAEFLVDRGNCLRFAAGDPSDLARAVRDLLADAGLRAHVVDQGRTTAAAFDADALADVFEGWYRHAAGELAEPPPDRTPPPVVPN